MLWIYDFLTSRKRTNNVIQLKSNAKVDTIITSEASNYLIFNSIDI